MGIDVVANTLHLDEPLSMALVPLLERRTLDVPSIDPVIQGGPGDTEKFGHLSRREPLGFTNGYGFTHKILSRKGKPTGFSDQVVLLRNEVIG